MTCEIPNCVRTTEAKGLCNAHYIRHRLGKSMDTPIRVTLPPKDRFWLKVNKRDEDNCWLWTANTTLDGYGSFRHEGEMRRAHRLSYEWHHGSIPEGMQVDHTCHKPACVNPSHLRLATNALNSQNRRGAHRGSKSGIRGVAWSKKLDRWRAYGHASGKQVHLGYFSTVEEAESASTRWRRENMPYSVMDRKKVS